MNTKTLVKGGAAHPHKKGGAAHPHKKGGAAHTEKKKGGMKKKGGATKKTRGGSNWLTNIGVPAILVAANNFFKGKKSRKARHSRKNKK